MSDGFDADVRVAILRWFLYAGRAPVPAELARDLGSSPGDVEAALRRLADGRQIVLAPGTPYVWMANPFSALPTPFRVEARGREWFGNCIWDALGCVVLLGGEGSVHTFCPDCAEPIELAVGGGVVRAKGVVHFGVPAAHWWDDIGFN